MPTSLYNCSTRNKQKKRINNEFPINCASQYAMGLDMTNDLSVSNYEPNCTICNISVTNNILQYSENRMYCLVIENIFTIFNTIHKAL